MAAFQWFKKRKPWWSPIAWQGWAIYIIYIVYSVMAYSRIQAQYQTVFFRLNWFFQEFLSVTIILAIVCWLTSKDTPEKTKKRDRRTT